MASIAGVSFGSPCDHLVRRFVILRYDVTIGYYIDVPADIDVADPSIELFVNNELFISSGATVAIETPTRALFGQLGGFGFGGFGEGGFGMGGFNSGVAIADLGNFPVDDIEMQFKTLPKFCPKCVLREDDGLATLPDTGKTIAFSGSSGGGFGGGDFGF